MPRRPRDDYDDEDDDFEEEPLPRRKRKPSKAEAKKQQMLYIMLAAGAVMVMACAGGVWFISTVFKEANKVARQFKQADPFEEAGEPIAKIKAEDLYKEFDKNEDKADDKYGGESIQVSGTVSTVEQVASGWRVTLNTGRAARVHAVFVPAKGQKVSQLTEGQAVTVIGICDGKIPDPTALGFGGSWVVSLSCCRMAN